MNELQDSLDEPVTGKKQTRPVSRLELISAGCWFAGLQYLRQGSGKTIEIGGRTLVRPFTFRENLQARVEDYNTLKDNTSEWFKDRFWEFSLDSCSAIVYPKSNFFAETTKFKVIPLCESLITMSKTPRNFLNVDYAKQEGIELNSRSSSAKYCQALSRREVLEHPAWLAIVEEDRPLLGETFDILKAIKNLPSGRGMGFYVPESGAKGKLWPLYINGCVGDSHADNCRLDKPATFLCESRLDSE